MLTMGRFASEARLLQRLTKKDRQLQPEAKHFGFVSISHFFAPGSGCFGALVRKNAAGRRR